MRLLKILFFVFFLRMTVAAHAEMTDCVFMEKTSFAIKRWPPAESLPSDDDKYFSYLVKIHQLDRGTKTAIIFRSFDQGEKDTSDDEKYWKVTIMLPAELGDEQLSLPLDIEMARASLGGSSWVKNGSGFFGMSVNGALQLRRISKDQILVQVHAKFKTQFAADPNERGDFQLDGNFILGSVKFEALTPWLGSSALPNTLESTFRPETPSNCQVESGK